MAEDINAITRAEVTVADEAGNFTMTLWVTSATSPDVPVVISKELNNTATPSTTYVNDVLGTNGYNPV